MASIKGHGKEYIPEEVDDRVPFDIGVEFCRKYGVEEILRPLLEFDPSSAGELHQTPTKEEANAAKRKQMYSGGLAGSLSNGRQYSQETNFTGYSAPNRFGPPLPVPSPTPSQPSQHSNYLPNRSDQQYVPAHWGNQPAQYPEPPAKRYRFSDQETAPPLKIEDSQGPSENSQTYAQQDFSPVAPIPPRETKNYGLSKDLMINLFQVVSSCGTSSLYAGCNGDVVENCAPVVIGYRDSRVKTFKET